MKKSGLPSDDKKDPYSVLMPVYHKENPEYFYQAAVSMMEQTISPDEFVLVCDGPLTEALERQIEQISRNWPETLKVIRMPECGGISRALAAGVKACQNEWIARMDSDDIACPDRCEKQMAFIRSRSREGKDLALLSGMIAEFVSGQPVRRTTDEDKTGQSTGLDDEYRKLPDREQITGFRMLPCKYEEILSYAHRRNPMNHMAVMMRRSAVLAVGNYHPIQGAEDYDLWVRMLQAGYRAENLPNVLVYARTDNGMIRRRGGMAYARATLSLQKRFYQNGFLSRRQYLINCAVRVTASLLPYVVRQGLYRRKLRSRVSGNTGIGADG